MAIILASGSPRRKELLEMMGAKDFLIIPAKGEEKAGDGLGPAELVKALASAKANEVAAGRPAEDIIIAADTIVWLDGEVFGKPHSKEEAKAMLMKLSGKEHFVYTGLSVIRGGIEDRGVEESRVRFREISEAEIERYIESGEPMDKAGAYGIQGRGSLFITGIDGDYYNIMGFPVCRLNDMLGRMFTL